MQDGETAESLTEDGVSDGSAEAAAQSAEGPSDDNKNKSSSDAGLGKAGSLEEQLVTESEARQDLDTEEEEENEEVEEEEEEPKLKYERVVTQTDFLGKDNASVLAVASSGKYIALGTHAGNVIVVNAQGEAIKQFPRLHAASVLALSFDVAADFLGTAAMDGKIAILPITNEDQAGPTIYDMQRPMRAIALDPDYSAKRNHRHFVSGGMAGALILHERSWLGNKDSTLHSGQGPIWAISWNPVNSIIAWCNDECVRIHDTKLGSRGGIGTVARPADSPRVDLFKCTFAWVNEDTSGARLQRSTLLVACADHITVVSVFEQDRQRTVNVPGVGSSTEWAVKTTAIFQLDAMLAGIALFPGTALSPSYHPESAANGGSNTNNAYLVLAYPNDDADDDAQSTKEATDDRDRQKRKQGSRPELRLISHDGEELSTDALAFANFERYQCNDYSLGSVSDSSIPRFYAISPKDIAMAQPRDALDHINWLIEHEDFEGALRSARGLPAKLRDKTDVTAIGIRHLQQLMRRGEYAKAAQSSRALLGSDAKRWDDWVFQFIEANQLAVIIPYMPINDPQLDHVVYEMALAYFLKSDPQMLLQTIHAWPVDIYDKNAIIVAVEDALEKDSDSDVLLNCIADLHIINQQPAKALPYFLQLNRPSTFALITENNLYNSISDSVLNLFNLQDKLQATAEMAKSKTAAIDIDQGPQSNHGVVADLLASHTQFVPTEKVLHQLRAHPRFLYMYLDTLFDRDATLASPYANRLVELYANFDYNKLLPFLRLGIASPEKAYEICNAKDLVPEMVFLLGRMGDNRKALRMLIERIGNVHRAIEFAKEQRDPELWEDLLTYSETRPTFIRGLLEESGAQGDPIQLIKRIRNGLEIPGLQSALVKILQDFTLQLSLVEGCESILASDCQQLSAQLNKAQTRAFLGGSERRCQGCGSTLFTSKEGSDKAVAVVFLCQHAYHASCAFPSTEAILPGRPLDTLSQIDFLMAKPPSTTLIDRQISGRLSYRVDLRSRMSKVVCPLCENHRHSAMTPPLS